MTPSKIYAWLPKQIIDPHCHGRDFKESHKTTLRQVMKEARRGGIATTVFMPNTNPPLIEESALTEYLVKIEVAKGRSGIKFPQYVYFGLTDDNLKECKKALKRSDVVGLKVYPALKGGGTVTTGSIGVSSMRVIVRAMELARKFSKVIAVHCDDPELIQLEGNTINAEVTYVKRIIAAAKEVPGVRVVICHVSCKESAEVILQAQAMEMEIAIELSPHHLWFDSSGTNWDYLLPPVFYHCFNKIRSVEHRSFLTNLLEKDSRLIFVGSDSACHTREEKIVKGFGGIPSNQELLSVILTLTQNMEISWHQLAKLLSFNTADFLRIPVIRELEKTELVWREEAPLYNEGSTVTPWARSKLLTPKMA